MHPITMLYPLIDRYSIFVGYSTMASLNSEAWKSWASDAEPWAPTFTQMNL